VAVEGVDAKQNLWQANHVWMDGWQVQPGLSLVSAFLGGVIAVSSRLQSFVNLSDTSLSRTCVLSFIHLAGEG
jgi:hypothetical protein